MIGRLPGRGVRGWRQLPQSRQWLTIGIDRAYLSIPRRPLVRGRMWAARVGRWGIFWGRPPAQ